MATATYVPLATTTLAGVTTTITFSGISQDYTDLRVIIWAYDGNSPIFYFNGNNSGYAYDSIGGYSGGASVYNSLTDVQVYLLNWNAPTTATPQAYEINIAQYASSTYRKTALSFSANDKNVTNQGELELNGGNWNSASAITSLSIVGSSSNFRIGTQATIYGIKAY